MQTFVILVVAGIVLSGILPVSNYQVSFSKSKHNPGNLGSQDSTNNGDSNPKTKSPPANEGEPTTTTPPANEGGPTTTTPPANEGGPTTTTPPANEGGPTTTTPPAN
ncbi:MAG: hypothetical protein ACTHKP_02490, partial [Nitrososphaeraceae archaeon]